MREGLSLRPWGSEVEYVVEVAKGRRVMRDVQTNLAFKQKPIRSFQVLDILLACVVFFRWLALGQIGDSARRFFHGPDLNNWDMALRKDIRLTESKQLRLRFEAFNIFNHARFENPDGSIDSSTFGDVTAAHYPRIMQIGAKFAF
jgi:hypothetical protein